MIKRISHIGIVVGDMDAAIELWTKTFGLKKVREMEVAVEGIRSVFLSANGKPDEMAIELMLPLNKSDMNNAVSRRLAKTGGGFYHLAVYVDNVESSGKKLKAKGLHTIDRPAATGMSVGRWLTHPKETSGVMVEGMQIE
ncbi:MAG: VOC family protein [Candidatus Lambdaproteobacteria bacterium]|nr:VOC family protein [Candidatus Lambdaproteobacteria bacterium]